MYMNEGTRPGVGQERVGANISHRKTSILLSTWRDEGHFENQTNFKSNPTLLRNPDATIRRHSEAKPAQVLRHRTLALKRFVGVVR